MNHLFIVGAQRSGSTYLYQLLDDHPEISMIHPVRPEPKFFINPKLQSKGVDYYHKYYFGDSKNSSKYFGEKSTSYLELEKAGQLMKEYFPRARILIILRDPVLRAYSNYRFSVQHGIEKESFADALALEHSRAASSDYATSVSPFAYRDRGYYINFIRKYLEIFDWDNVHIIIFEELVNNLQRVQELYRWLGVSAAHEPSSLMEKVNSAEVMGVDQPNEFYDLAKGYRTSIIELEGLLGRQIPSWNSNHQKIINLGRPKNVTNVNKWINMF